MSDKACSTKAGLPCSISNQASSIDMHRTGESVCPASQVAVTSSLGRLRASAALLNKNSYIEHPVATMANFEDWVSAMLELESWCK